MKYRILIYCLIAIIAFSSFNTYENSDYIEYHKQITKAEKFLSEQQFVKALITYEQVFKHYEFVFLRDYKVASQLAFYLGDKKKAFDFIKMGIAAGWELKDLKKNNFLKSLQNNPEWSTIIQSYDNLRSSYERRIDWSLREHVHLMFKKDQKKALGALFRIGNKAQEKYGTMKFAPHSENQMLELIDILNNQGYPGEKLIGNDFWMSTIISHHNSISLEYNKKDTLYVFIKPKLVTAIEKGNISPYEFALIDDWQIAVSSKRTMPGYGFLQSPVDSTLSKTNQLRQKIGLRTINIRNKLVTIERNTGMNFYLPDWVNGSIKIE
ncbi:hypothetical protein [Urechidicola vernalis]|uniref:Tetratricopeptide repeat protein n=1 Tax=Urechidicola vernalis TaxID=3075600 RepID=A0ABU2Y6F1_9FLAO|nr:hypothetical protein [Urechidicola sp. P050]MDT0553775.1 hypothetical protein [Urechidicola sp. P050]